MFILYARRIRNISSGKGRRGVGKQMLRAWIWQEEVGCWKGHEQRCSCGGISIDCSRHMSSAACHRTTTCPRSAGAAYGMDAAYEESPSTAI